jgi:hypothetical protein
MSTTTGCCQDDTEEPCQDDKSAVSNRVAPTPSAFLDVYWGSDASTALTNAGVSALQNSQQKSSFADTYVCDANNYKYISYPASFGTATSFINTLNGLNVPMDTMYTVTINSLTYNVHRSFFPIVGAVSIAIS